VNNFDKKAFRNIYLTKRLKLSKKFTGQTSKKIAEKLLSLKEIAKSSTFSLYLPINNEIETNLIIDTLILKDARILVPAYFSGIKSYVLSRFVSWQDLEEGPFKIFQPTEIKSVDPSLVEIAIMPGLAFSHKGVRLGYGKGVFDKLFAKSKALKIGLAYDFQIIDKIPKEEHDLIMDLVVTEKRVVRC
jgi:5-formyltetrahydrofolate cyclo-ligase